MGDLQNGIVSLLNASVAPNTAAAYRTAINAFIQFSSEFSLPSALPISTHHVVLFISYCFEKGLSLKTINTYIAGLNYLHKLNGYNDLREPFIVKKMIEGCLRLRKQGDSRLPITIAILQDVCAVLTVICYNHYEACLFKAAYVLAFFGLFRVSELVVPSSLLTNRTLMRQDVCIDSEYKYVSITLRVWKTNQSGPPTTLKIPKEKKAELCPVQAMREFLALRPDNNGPLFCHASGYPVTRCQFSAVLAKCIRRVRPNCPNITSHSFRIGQATHLAALGLSSDSIKTLGRWHSDAYKTYIRS